MTGPIPPRSPLGSPSPAPPDPNPDRYILVEASSWRAAAGGDSSSWPDTRVGDRNLPNKFGVLVVSPCERGFDKILGPLAPSTP